MKQQDTNHYILVDEWDVKWLDMVQLNWIDYDLR
jgi:hypothetical protein